MKNEVDKVIERYSKAVTRRIQAKTRLLNAQKEETASRNELIQAKADLRNLETELGESVLVPGLVLISEVLKHQDEQPA